MSAEDHSTIPEDLTPLLVACENALAAGAPPPDASADEIPTELRPRLDRNLACMRLLRQVLPRRAAVPAAPANLGRFLLRRELGRGAFGVVFLAHDPFLGRDVALKLPRPEALLTAELRQRFVREARAAAGLDHPNLVAVHEAGEVGAVCYIASAYCPGATLGTWLKGCRDPVPAGVAARLVATLAEAVQHAHGHGVIHRDLKPNNVLLQSDLSAEPATTSLFPKIADFGLAKYALDAAVGTEEPTRSGAVMGTPSYMAPEQASGQSKQVGPAADVYGLGAILYEVLTGRPPFQGDTSLDTLEQVRSREPLPPRRLRPKLPRDLETICLKCLRKEPAQRYASAQALADDLQRFLAGEPIRARPTGRVERLRRWCRRKPALAGLTAALVLLFLGSFIAVTALWLRAEEHRRRVEESDRRNREIVNQFFTRVSEEQLLQEPGLQPLRKKLLQDALEYYRSFIRQRRDDPKLRAELADAYQRLGSIIDQIGSKAEALAAFQEARRLREQLVRANPSDRQLRRHLAESSLSMGDVYQQTGRLEDALRCYEAALTLRERLVQEDPTDAGMRGSLAWAHHCIGGVYGAKGETAKALSCYELAHAIRRQLVRDYPDVASYQHDLARSHNVLGNHQSTNSKFAEALQSYEEARAIQEEVVKNNPANLDFQSTLAMIHYNIGFLHARSGRPKEAFASYEAAHKLYKKLADANPTVTHFQHELASALNTIGLLQSGDSARQAQALETLKESWKIRKRLADAYPSIPDFQHDLAASYLNLASVQRLLAGQKAAAFESTQRACAIWEKLHRDNPDIPGYEHNLAMAYNGLAVLRMDAKPEEALSYFQKALAIRERHYQANPKGISSRSALATTYYNIGSLEHNRGRSAAALPFYAKARDLQEQLVREQPEVPSFHKALALTYVDLFKALQGLHRYAEALSALASATKHGALPAVSGSPGSPTTSRPPPAMRDH